MIQRRNIYRYAVPARPIARQPRPRRGGSSRAENGLALAAGSISLLVYLGVGLALTLVYGYFAFYNAVLPGVSSGGIALGGLTVEQAEERLASGWQRQQAVAMSDGTRTWAAAPASLGFALDARASAERAALAGRDAGGWPLLSGLVGLKGGAVAPVVRFDPAAARGQLAIAAGQMEMPAVEAGVHFRDGHWVASPGLNGAVLDVEATVAAWGADPGGLLAGGRLPLVLRAVAPQVADVSAVAARLEAQMQTGLRVQLYDPIRSEVIDWLVGPAELAAWVRVQEGAGGLHITLERGPLEEYLRSRQAELGAGRTIGEIRGLDDLTQAWQDGRPLTVLVRHPASTYSVLAGEQLIGISMKVGIPYWLIVRANPGIDPDALVPGLVLNIPSPDELLPLPVVLNKRIVISISQQKLWAYEDGALRSESVISTGIARSPTMPGVFQVRSHDLNAYASLWNLWMPHFMGIYEAAPGFMNGIHGLPTLSSGQRLWADVLGQPASYGCIIMTLAEAEDLYKWAEEGTVVEIKP